MTGLLAIAALSLALGVPYLPQTDALCGGAAAAMVFRYWGDAHADPQEFASLVDRRAGGIADAVLVDAVRRRGWGALRIDGSRDALTASLAAGRPVIVLLGDRRDRYHYVVVTGETRDGWIVHDPSWGPSRTVEGQEFDIRWRASNSWGLVVLPPVGRDNTVAPDLPGAEPDTGNRSGTACDALLAQALDDVRRAGFSEADAILRRVRTACPADAGPWRELAGVRFAERRWSDAASLAREALARDGRDAYAIDLLGSSLFMQDDEVGALRAWNQNGRPRVNLVRIEGLRHARYQTITEALSLRPNMLLTADAFERARRRLDELPDRLTARLALRPENDGFATVDVVISESSGVPQDRVSWVATGLHAAIEREADVSIPGAVGVGDVWSAQWRWWENRPGVAIQFATPRTGALRGVWRVDASWDAQSYSSGPASAVTRESRARGGLTVSDWLSGGIRYSASAGIDVWNGDRKAVALGGAIEHRFFGDRIALAVDAERWIAAGGPSFQSAGARLRVHSLLVGEGWAYDATAGAEEVSDAAPLALWPGAGEGRARTALARAHPLLDAGVIELNEHSLFGRSIVNGTAEAQRWLDRPRLPRIAFASFVDIVRASRRAADAAALTEVDLGGGVRVKIPGMSGVLRVDAARGVVDGARALTIGWQY